MELAPASCLDPSSGCGKPSIHRLWPGCLSCTLFWPGSAHTLRGEPSWTQSPVPVVVLGPNPLLTRYLKALPEKVRQEARVQSLGWQVPLEKGMAIHSCSLAWRIAWTEKPGGLQFMRFQWAGHDWVTNTVHSPEKAQPQYLLIWQKSLCQGQIYFLY